MKNRIILLAFLLVNLSVFAQTVDQIYTFGGASHDGVWQSSAMADNGDLVYVNTFQGTVNFNPQGTTNLTSAGNHDLAIQKLDSDGNLLWVKQIGIATGEYVYDVDVDANDNIYIAGKISWGTVDVDPGVGVFDIVANEGHWFCLKLDSDGNFIWAKNTEFEIQGVEVSSVGDVYLSGSFQTATDFDPGMGDVTIAPVNMHDMAIVKLNVNGDFQWVETMGGGNNDIARDVALNNSETKLWIGVSYSSASFSDYPTELGLSPSNQGGEDFTIFQYDLITNLYTFVHNYGSSGTEQLAALVVDNNDDLLVTGRFQNTVNFDHTGTLNLTASSYSPVVLKINSDLSFGWAKTFGSSSTDQALNMCIDDANNVYTCGYFYDDIDLDPSASTDIHVLLGTQDYYIQKLNASGNYVWGRTYGGTGVQNSYDIHINNLYELYITGKFENTVDFNNGASPVMNASSVSGTSDIFIQKIVQCVPSTSTFVHAACSSYTWIDGNTYTASNNTATYILNNAATSGCDSIITLDLTINTPETVTIPAVTAVCSNVSPFNMNSIVVMPSGGTFSNQYISSNSFNTNSAGVSTQSYSYSVIGSNGCLTSAIADIQVLSVPTISLTITNANCGQDNGSVEANVTGGLAPYEKYWNNGETTDIITSLVGGNYYYNVTDANNCNVMKVATVTVGEVGITGTVTSNQCYGDVNGAIDINISGSAGPFTYYWSNGATTEDVQNLVTGQYEVFVTDANDCVSSRSFNVSGPDFFTASISEVQPTTCGAADGGLTSLINGGTLPYTYSWNNNLGSEVSTNQNPTGLTEGYYTLNLLDANNCTFSTVATISDPDAASITINSVVPVTCSSAGAIDVSVESLNTVVDTLWSNGATTEDISGLTVGDYILRIEDDLGCFSNLAINVANELPVLSEICLVTVDTNTNTNLIVWEKPVTSEIDYFVIYRETSVANEFLAVDTVQYEDESIFTDPVAYPGIRSWRYKMTNVNQCGIESDYSAVHKTIHIAVSPGLGSDVNVFWDHYEGFTYSTYDLWRFTDVAGWELVQSLPLSSTSYTDTPANTGGLDYIISITPPSLCQSTKAQDHNASRSNKSSNATLGNGEEEEEEEEETDGLIENSSNSNVLVYPNPSTAVFNVTINGVDLENQSNASVYDLNGRLIKSFIINSNQFNVDLLNNDSGIYVLEIKTNDTIIRNQLIKE